MTAQEVLEDTLTMISGTKIEKDKDFNALLRILNTAKTKLARDTKIWIGGETITLTEEKEYTLSEIPIQIIEIYDENLQIRPRSSMAFLGYTQIAPNKIFVNNPETGTNLNINWFEEPNDFLLESEVFLPNDLILALQHYVCHKVYLIYKGDSETVKSNIHLNEYNMIINDYILKNPENDIDSIYQTDMITMKGLV